MCLSRQARMEEKPSTRPPRSGQRAVGRPILASELLARLAALGLEVDSSLSGATPIRGIHHDSRCIARGELFVALPGSRCDGGGFVRSALTAGAVAAVCDRATRESLGSGLPLLVVADVEACAGRIAAVVFGEPAAALQLVGVTGTNGKTSCTYLLESVWQAAGRKVGVIGTVTQRWPGHRRVASMTTPPARDLQALLAEISEAGCDTVAMEVSSHALAQHRVSGCSFDVAIFTNLTRDHLDYHGSEEDYFAAKARLFHEYLREDGGIAVLNADDPWVMRLATSVPGHRVRTFSIDPDSNADVRVVALEADLGGMRAQLWVRGQTLAIDTQLVGRPNLANIVAVVAAADAMGVPHAEIADGVGSCAAVPGRLERIADTRPAVFVDYAHTPDALERSLQTIRETSKGRLLVVFGCGGDRDCGKRPLMGEIAGRIADIAVLTSDNPRSEDPAAILAQIEEGIGGGCVKRTLEELSGEAVGGYAVEADRGVAIRAAVALAGDEDVVVVAGKGHETYQEVSGVRHDFDDRALVAKLLSDAGARS